MSFNRNHVRAFLAKTEIDLFESSLSADLKALSATEVQRRIDRTRKLRDKYRDLLRRQKLATRARTGSKRGISGEANERTAKKAKAFEETLTRFEAQAKHLAAAAKKAAAKSKKSPAKAKSAATPKPAARKSAKTSAKSARTSAAKTAAKTAPKTAAKKRAPKKQLVPAAVMLRAALEKKHAAETRELAARPTRSHKAPAQSSAAPVGGVGATPPDVRAAVVASRLDQSGMARIQGHAGTQVRKAQGKRDQRG